MTELVDLRPHLSKACENGCSLYVDSVDSVDTVNTVYAVYNDQTFIWSIYYDRFLPC